MYILEVEQCRAIVSDSMQVLFCTLQNRFENKLTVDVIRCNPDKLENSKKKKKILFWSSKLIFTCLRDKSSLAGIIKLLPERGWTVRGSTLEPYSIHQYNPNKCFHELPGRLLQHVAFTATSCHRANLNFCSKHFETTSTEAGKTPGAVSPVILS